MRYELYSYVVVIYYFDEMIKVDKDGEKEREREKERENIFQLIYNI